ncbi:MAG TPA: hypothetical protein VLE70_12725, partial [Anaerolineae bacterium]|nr:hypothetical protein [Anaerolineae bacterium]
RIRDFHPLQSALILDFAFIAEAVRPAFDSGVSDGYLALNGVDHSTGPGLMRVCAPRTIR